MAPEEKRNRWLLPIGMGVAVFLVGGLLAALWLLGGEGDDVAAPAPVTPVATTEEPTEEPRPEQTTPAPAAPSPTEVAPEPVTVRWGERGSLAEIRNMEITTEVAGGRAEAEALAADIEAAVAPIAVTMPVKGGVYITVNAIDGERKYRHWQQRSFDQLADDYQLPREK